MLKSLRFLLLALIAISCGASINPEFQQRINSDFSKTKTGSFTMSGKFLRPMPLAVGQWVMFGVTNDGKRSIQKTSIIAKEADGWVMESYSLDESKENITQMCITGFDEAAKTGNMDAIEIKWIRTKDENGQIQKIDGFALSMMKGIYKNALSLGLSGDISSSMESGSVSVPAGTFGNSAKINSEVTFLGSTYRSVSWYHSDVPISGMVKSVSEDNKNITELLDFGTTGAKASF